MGEFNVNKTDGSLIPTAGYGGMIKINGTTLADLITALNGMTEDQKTRCEVLLYLNGENLTNFFVLKRCNVTISNVGSETHDIYSCSDDEVTIYDGTTRITHYATSLHITKLTSGTTAKISRVSGSNGYDLTSSLSSWSILYQDDSVTGGNTYPASHVMMSDGETSVEDALDYVNDKLGLKIKYFDVSVPVTSTSYNFSNDKPSDLKAILSAMSIVGGGAVIMQTSASVLYFDKALVNDSTIRIIYVAY